MNTSLQKLEISILKNKKENFTKLLIVNNDTSLTEKIISQNIQFQNLKYKLTLTRCCDMTTWIKSRKINEFYRDEERTLIYIDYKPGDFSFDMPITSQDHLYKISLSLIEKIGTIQYENEIWIAQDIHLNKKLGLITNKILLSWYKDKFKPKRYFASSEKANISELNNQIQINGWEGTLNQKDIKTFTYESRMYPDIKQFVNSKYKSSKIMNEKRQKKVWFATQSDIHFEKKMEINGDKKNPFMKNEWFMGPIYAYDYNYEDYI